MDKVKWYTERNDRTNRIDEVLLNSESKRIGVIIENPETYSSQVMALISLNIMSRWCRKISIQIPGNINCILKDRTNFTFNKLLEKTVSEADPFGDFKLENVENDKCEIILIIGSKNIFENKTCYWINSSGWVYGFGYGCKSQSIQTPKNENPLGAAFSAISINSLIFSEYINLVKNEFSENWLSLFDFNHNMLPNTLNNPNFDIPLDFGEIWQIGAGAVGSSFNYILSLLCIKSSLKIIDYDEVSIANTSSSLSFTADDAFNSKKKIYSCKDLLKETEYFNVKIHDGDYSSFIDKGHLENIYPDIILCFANEKNIWSTIQYNDPPLVLHATTSSNWGINFGRHIPFKEWCVVCRFGNTEYQYTPVCSEGLVTNSEGKDEKLGTLPFLSAASSVLVLGEMIKLSLYKNSNYPINENFIQLSLKEISSSKFMSIQRQKGDGCSICKNQMYDNYHSDYKQSKFC